MHGSTVQMHICLHIPSQQGPYPTADPGDRSPDLVSPTPCLAEEVTQLVAGQQTLASICDSDAGRTTRQWSRVGWQGQWAAQCTPTAAQFNATDAPQKAAHKNYHQKNSPKGLALWG